jgi:hypothetical protein
MLKHLSWRNYSVQGVAREYLNAMHYTPKEGSRLVKLRIIFVANTVTAVISVTAEMGSHDQAE